MDNDISSVITSEGRMYDPSEVLLIGAHMEPLTIDGKSQREMRQTGYIKVQSDLVETMTLKCHPVQETSNSGVPRDTNPSIAIIYAYAYEGHTYRLPKPRIMVVASEGELFKPSPEDDKTGVTTGRLYMWRMSKHSHTVSIEIESGSLETLVLDGNQPGNRSVTSYHSHMQLAHRGGRLT